MAEIKHTFTAGRMNKDLDERLVPNGEYRDALNIQSRTSDGSNVGAVQNVLANTKVGESIEVRTPGGVINQAVGSITDEANDAVYFMFASPELEVDPADGGRTVYMDQIVEHKANGQTDHIFKDLFAITEDYVSAGSPTESGYFTEFTVADASIYRAGMRIRVLNAAGENLLAPGTRVLETNNTSDTITLDRQQNANLADARLFVWEAERVLNFKIGHLIPAINILDGFLMWTDNRSEPKKINIERCRKGTSTGLVHTKLMLAQDNGNLIAAQYVLDDVEDSNIREEHITVIKKAPLLAPNLEMSSSDRNGEVEFTINLDLSQTDEGTVTGLVANADIRIGDFVSLVLLESGIENSEYTAKLKITDYNGSSFDFVVVSKTAGLLSTQNTWRLSLDQKKPIFELKFPRFGYRYKYEDNEYSSFSPWSELAFLPGDYDYEPKKAYNLGMVNTVRSLVVKDWLPDSSFRPDDIKSIEILYKSTDSPVVYVVKEIKRNLGSEWDVYGNEGGKLLITSEMIHQAVESNQILRAWDNVPRFARAQEITANRLIYGNYVQGYDVNAPVTVEQNILSREVEGDPKKSVKSMRTYKWGMVFGDKYGRETPVLGTGTSYREDGRGTSIIAVPSDVYVDKELAKNSNYFRLKQNWSTPTQSFTPESWMDYVRYYVKETSTEYYNLVMDRWYDAEDGNIWISFESSDRNKVDEETYLILKKENGNALPVEEDARYKIIAIENEAPDFIKTKDFIMGSVEFENGTDLNTDDVPFFSNYVEFTLNAAAFTNFISNSSFRGVPRVRVYAQAGDTKLYTKTVTITKYQAPTGGQDGSMTTSEPFGDSADLVNRAVGLGIYANVTQADSNIEYYLEFIDRVQTSKPEFDGRFFVKIEKDSTIERKIMGVVNNDPNYNVVGVFHPRYINTTSNNHPAVNGPFANQIDNDLGGYLDGDFGGLPIPPGIDNLGDCHQPIVYGNRSKLFWETMQGRMFIDDARSHNDSGLPNDWGEEGNNKSGLSKSGQAANNTYDRIAFGYRSSTLPDHVLAFKAHMMSPGRRFRFIQDPNNSVYVIKGGQAEWNNVYNYRRVAANVLGATICGTCNDEDGNKCRRITWRTTIRRLDANGVETNEGIDINQFDPRGLASHDGQQGGIGIELLEPRLDNAEGSRTNGVLSGVFETEPKENVELDIYYEASNSLPLIVDESNIRLHAPEDSVVTFSKSNGEETLANKRIRRFVVDKIQFKNADNSALPSGFFIGDNISFLHSNGTTTHATINGFYGLDGDVAVPALQLTGIASITAGSDQLQFSGAIPGGWAINDQVTGPGLAPQSTIVSVNVNTITLSAPALEDATSLTYTIHRPASLASIDPNVWKQPVDLNWFNCYSFGNGVESDRIRDDFNAPTIDNGVAASATIAEYGEERLKNSLIFSGLYNSLSGVNNLNEFNMAEGITKDINPTYGSIQALLQRDVDLITFLEDKVGNILANKDALFNADGNTNVTATSKVLGQFIPYTGDYGISTNPESLVKDEFRCYFTDKVRGAVLRLSKNGITPISNVGMRDYFRDNLRNCSHLVGTWDNINGEYNLSMHAWPNTSTDDITVTFNEAAKGWISFKSFVTYAGETVAGKYYTTNQGNIWKHYNEGKYNNFYGTQYDSSITVMLNDMPSSVKLFNTLNYEGTQSRVVLFGDGYLSGPYNDVDGVGMKTANTVQGTFYNSASNDQSDIQFLNSGTAADFDYYNDVGKSGWYVSDIKTDMQEGTVDEFREKEGKWFNYIKGEQSNLNNMDSSEFTIKGIRESQKVSYVEEEYSPEYTVTIKNDPNE